jgi:predicted Zn finger-like uncharacterized protein
MSIRIICPQCTHSYSVADELAGRKIRCKNCGEPIKIPRPEVADEPESPDEPRPVQAAVWSAKNIAALIGILAVLGFILMVVISTAADGETLSMIGILLACSVGLVLWWLLPWWLADRMGRERTCGTAIALLSVLFFGWFGLAIISCFPKQGKRRKCPDCAEWVKAEAKVCKHCGKKLA